jgi:hypothetical protein
MRDGLLALLGVVAVSGCSYDWTVGPPASDADGSADGAFSTDGALKPDALPDGSTDAAAETSVTDGPPEASEAAPLPGCTTQQEGQVQQARAAALVCTGVTPDPCEVTVLDECGCKVIVAADNNAEAQYIAAIKALQSACIPLCASGCGTAPSPGVCLVSDAGAGAYACYQ